jgi:hypothetical protein
LDPEVLRFAQDFACGLGRPQRGSSSTPAASTNSFTRDVAQAECLAGSSFMAIGA